METSISKRKEMILFASPAYIKENTVLHYNIDDGYLLPLINSIQQTFIRPILGSALYDQIITEIENNSVLVENSLLIKEYISPALKWEVCHKFVRIGTYKLRNKGAGKKGGDGFSALDSTELILAKNIFKDNADFFRKKIVLFLKENDSDYPLYKNPPSGCSVVLPDKNIQWRSQFNV